MIAVGTTIIVIFAALFGAVGVVMLLPDECDPSENLELSRMTSEELDALCGKDREFHFLHE